MKNEKCISSQNPIIIFFFQDSGFDEMTSFGKLTPIDHEGEENHHEFTHVLKSRPLHI